MIVCCVCSYVLLVMKLTTTTIVPSSSIRTGYRSCAFRPAYALGFVADVGVGPPKERVTMACSAVVAWPDQSPWSFVAVAGIDGGGDEALG